MITEATRACPTCSTILPTDPPHTCATCSRVVVPPVEQWPKDLVRWLVGQQVAAFFAPLRRMTRQHRYERLLVSVIAGRQWGSRIVPRAVDAADCWVIAHAETERWIASGRPALFE